MQSTTRIYPGRCKVASVLPNLREGKIFRAMSRKTVAQVFEYLGWLTGLEPTTTGITSSVTSQDIQGFRRRAF
jgi:hypothetical protein